MKPPIIIYEHGDISVFASPAEACDYLEPIDVKNNEYVAYDSAGAVLRVELIRDKKINSFWGVVERDKVILKRTQSHDVDGLSEKIRAFLLAAGVPGVDRDMELSELIGLL